MAALNIIIFEKDNIVYVALVNVAMFFNLIGGPKEQTYNT